MELAVTIELRLGRLLQSAAAFPLANEVQKPLSKLQDAFDKVKKKIGFDKIKQARMPCCAVLCRHEPPPWQDPAHAVSVAPLPRAAATHGDVIDQTAKRIVKLLAKSDFEDDAKHARIVLKMALRELHKVSAPQTVIRSAGRAPSRSILLSTFAEVSVPTGPFSGPCPLPLAPRPGT